MRLEPNYCMTTHLPTLESSYRTVTRGRSIWKLYYSHVTFFSIPLLKEIPCWLPFLHQGSPRISGFLVSEPYTQKIHQRGLSGLGGAVLKCNVRVCSAQKLNKKKTKKIQHSHNVPSALEKERMYKHTNKPKHL